MAAPTQELPPWLSYSTETFTDAAGIPVATSSLVYLPLTYYGPSVSTSLLCLCLSSSYSFGNDRGGIILTVEANCPKQDATPSVPIMTVMCTS